MELPFSFHSHSIFFFLYLSLFLQPPLFSLFVLEAEPKVIALYRQRGFSSYFSQCVPCALAGIACLMEVTCSLGRATWEPFPLMHCCAAGLAQCVCACLWLSCWRYLIPFIVHLTRIPGGMRVRVEYLDILYRCLVCTWEKRKTGRGGKWMNKDINKVRSKRENSC